MTSGRQYCSSTFAWLNSTPAPLPSQAGCDNSHLPPEDQRISLSLRERARVRAKFRAALKFAKFLGGQAEGSHPFPSRTRKLSPPAPTILTGQLVGKIGRRRGFLFGRQQIHKSKPLDALTPINSLLFLKVKFFSTPLVHHFLEMKIESEKLTEHCFQQGAGHHPQGRARQPSGSSSVQRSSSNWKMARSSSHNYPHRTVASGRGLGTSERPVRLRKRRTLSSWWLAFVADLRDNSR